ncbi:hypothetical protein LTR56_017057 [Elasticomyces elasticus]|nr:hypothetical protein LTR56_017057 [Elasticomyces elasticus]KAK4912667.1 hypothetical protein LTR49_018936 [Elasticomyces elasticus]
MATAALLATTELLEAILCQLEFSDLMTTRGVSKKWLATIADSIKLRRKLFLAPEISGTPFTLSTWVFEDVPIYGTFMLTPLFQPQPFAILPIFRRKARYSCGYGSCTFKSPPSPDKVTRCYRFGWPLPSLAHGSLRREHFLTQPPCPVVLLEAVCFRDARESRRLRAPRCCTSYASVRMAGGVTVGAVADTFAEMWRTLPTAEQESGCGGKLTVSFLVEEG